MSDCRGALAKLVLGKMHTKTSLMKLKFSAKKAVHDCYQCWKFELQISSDSGVMHFSAIKPRWGGCPGRPGPRNGDCLCMISIRWASVENKKKMSKQRLLKEKVDWAKGLIKTWKQGFQNARTTLWALFLSSHLSNVAARAISWRHTLLRLTIDDRRRISQLPRVHLALLQRTAKNEYSCNKNTQVHRDDGKGNPC